MSEIAKAGVPSLSTVLPNDTNRLGPFLAGETIAAGDACYIKTSDGKVYRSTGAAANAAAEVDGFAAMPAGTVAPGVVISGVNRPVTLYHDVNFNYGTGLSPGSFVYLSGTVAGGLADAASTGGTAKIGRVIDATRIRLTRSY